MFIDASVLVAILTGEEDAEALSARLGEAEVLYTSPLALFEAAAALMRSKGETAEGARKVLQQAVTLIGAQVISITDEIGAMALEAYGKFGKGQGHPARLNMGDCFAHACARAHGVGLIYKGDDFTQTDMA